MSKFQACCILSETLLNCITTTIGKSVSWLSLLMAIVTAAIVIMRSIFDIGSVGAQESLIYMHALIIMLASAYTYKEDGHVRVDIFYRRFTPTQKAWVDVLGCTLLLLPLAIFTIAISWEYVASSWSVLETSSDAGGIPAVFILKSLLLINGFLLALQSIAEITRNLVTLTFTDKPYQKTY